MEDIYIAGVGMTPFGRMLDVDIKTMTRQATEAALADAGIDKSKLGAAYFANVSQGHMERQHMIRGEIALRSMGVGGIPVVNVENACASGSTAFNTAVNYVKAGQGDVALAIGAEKMCSQDRGLMFSVFDSGWDVTAREQTVARLTKMGEGVEVPEATMSSKPYSVFMDVYAAFSRFHMRRFGTTRAQIAAVAAKNHNHSVHNPLSQYRNAYTVEEVLAAPPIAYPLTLPMCSPISDGAAAAVVCSRSALKRLGIDEKGAIRVLASLVQSGADREPDEVEKHVTALAAKRAYQIAGIGPKDVSVAEVHDATAMGEIIQLENLDFCAFGEGGAMSERGRDADRRPHTCQSIGRARVERASERPGSARSTSSSRSCAAKPASARSPTRALRWPRTAAAFTASRRRWPASRCSVAEGFADRCQSNREREPTIAPPRADVLRDGAKVPLHISVLRLIFG